LLEKGQFSTFEPGKTLMEPGQFVKAVPLVLEGSIKIMRMDEDGKELFLYYLEAGETCALSLTCCSASKPSEIKAVIEEKATLLFVPIQVHEYLPTPFSRDAYRIGCRCFQTYG
jgi:CRP/FNR family transcriptional regulator